MARSKDTGTDNVESSVFPEGYQMNSWNDDGRELGLASERRRVDDTRPTSHYKRHRGRLDRFPFHEIPSDMQYINATNTLLNEPQGDNLQELYEDGYDFVKQSAHPTYKIPELYTHTDGNIRTGACITMKKYKPDYEAAQRANQEESTSKQRDVMACTDYFGAPAGQPRFLVENSGSYTPNYSNKRG